MSGRVVGWAFRAKTSSSTSKLVLVKLADNSDDDGVCYPTVALICKYTQLSERAVRAAIKALEDDGLISVDRRSINGARLANSYQLRIPESVGVVQDVHPGTGAGRAENRVQDVHPKRKEETPEEKKEEDSSSEPQAASEPAVISIPAIERGSAYRVTKSQEDHWADLYPAVNVPQTLRAILGWCEANPKKRKTLGGIPKFINSWLAREQDRGGLKLNGDGVNGHGHHRTQPTATDKHLAGLAMLRDEIRNR